MFPQAGFLVTLNGEYPYAVNVLVLIRGCARLGHDESTATAGTSSAGRLFIGRR